MNALVREVSGCWCLPDDDDHRYSRWSRIWSSQRIVVLYVNHIVGDVAHLIVLYVFLYVYNEHDIEANLVLSGIVFNGQPTVVFYSS